jgi:AmmeMemoRadiSam system protein A/AmmeMemoRadiSam system protein B
MEQEAWQMSVKYACIVPHPPLIIPAVGKGEESRIQKTIDAYEAVGQQIAHLKPETIVLATPHSVMYADYIHISPGKRAVGDLGRFGAPRVSVAKDYDTELAEALADIAGGAGVRAGLLGEKDAQLDHGTLVPLCFVEQHYSDYRLVRVSISGQPLVAHYRFGQCVAQAAEQLGRHIVFVASGDLSHKLTQEGPYGFAPEGPAFDKQLTEAMRTGDFMQFLRFGEAFCEAAGECGLRAFIEMAGALDGKSVQPDFRSYEGPFGVGYAVCGYAVTGSDENRRFAQQYEKERKEQLAAAKAGEDAYVRLARLSLEMYVKTGRRVPMPDDLPDELLARRAGVFVSLKKDGRLRGCIGTISPEAASIAEEIVHNAVSAGTGDPRFDPVKEDELDALVYSVDVLGDAEPIASMEQLDAARYGVIVTKGHRRGLLLPNLDGVDTPEQQVSIALQKAGIRKDDSYTMERFEVVRHK